MKGKVIGRSLVRSKSVDRRDAKQYFEVVEMEDGSHILNITRLRLVDHVDLEDTPLKTYKGKYLCSSEFGIKLDTLAKVTTWIGEILTK